MGREIERAFAFAAKIQSAVGTGAHPTMADDALRLAAPVEVETDWVSRNPADGEQTGGKGSFPSSPPAGRMHKFRIRRRLRGIDQAYAVGTYPEEDAILMALLGYRNVVTDVGSEAVEYSGLDTGESVLSCIAQTMTKEFSGIDAVPVSASLELEAGKHLVLVMEFESVGEAPTQQVLEAATLDSVVPPIFKNGVFTLGGTALKPSSFRMDCGLSVSEPIMDGTAADAWSGKVITDRLPTGNFQIQVEDLATFDPYAKEASAEQMALVFASGPAATQYNRVRIEADKLEISRVKDVVKGGMKYWDIDYKINRATSPSVKDPVIIFD